MQPAPGSRYGLAVHAILHVARMKDAGDMLGLFLHVLDQWVMWNA